jgi:hypothetical protein
VYTGDFRVTRDDPSYLPSAGQYNPAIAYNPSNGTSLVAWEDQGRRSEATSEFGIWGRIWVPIRQAFLPLALQAY